MDWRAPRLLRVFFTKIPGSSSGPPILRNLVTGSTQPLIPGTLVMIAGTCIYFVVCLLQTVAGGLAASKGAFWADALSRGLARSVEAAASSDVSVDDRVLAACSYASCTVGIVSFLSAPKGATFRRFHAAQGALLVLLGVPLTGGVLFLIGAWVPSPPALTLEWGAALPAIASLPILGLAVFVAVHCFRGMRRAGRGETFRVPLLGGLARRLAG